MTYVSAQLRLLVIERAGNCCEYCHVHADYRHFPYEIDHIIAEKHGGTTTAENLCWSCYICNAYKGSDIGSVDWEGTRKLTPLFNPREQVWSEHFRLDKFTAEFVPLTAEGRVTVFLLRLNADEHVMERQFLMQSGFYPC